MAQDIGNLVKRFQQIKANERRIAIAKASIKSSNPNFTRQQIDELYNKQHKIVTTNYAQKKTVAEKKD